MRASLYDHSPLSVLTMTFWDGIAKFA
jgi:cytoskeletal protein CcmA (bactofilin family)